MVVKPGCTRTDDSEGVVTRIFVTSLLRAVDGLEGAGGVQREM